MTQRVVVIGATGHIGRPLCRELLRVRNLVTVFSRDPVRAQHVVPGAAGYVAWNMSREQGDHLSALAAGVQSLARGAGQQVGGGEVRQTIIEMDSAFMFVMAAGQGTCLAVLASADANLGVMAYEMAMLVRRMGTYLTAAPRPADHEPVVG